MSLISITPAPVSAATAVTAVKAEDPLDLAGEIVLGTGKKITWGTDANLYRGGANQVKTDDALYVVGNIETDGTVDGVDIAARDHAASHTGISHSDIGSTGAAIDAAVSASHAASHNAASHSDIAATGAEIDAAVAASHAEGVHLTGAGAIAAVEGEATLALTGVVTIPVDTALNISSKARAYLSANQENLTKATWIKVLLDTESYDIGSDFDKDTNNRFVVPVSGYYDIKGVVAWLDSSIVSDNKYYAAIYVDGTIRSYGVSHSSPTDSLSSVAVDTLYIVANSYIELYAYQNSGVDTVDIVSGELETHLAVHLLSV